MIIQPHDNKETIEAKKLERKLRIMPRFMHAAVNFISSAYAKYLENEFADKNDNQLLDLSNKAKWVYCRMMDKILDCRKSGYDIDDTHVRAYELIFDRLMIKINPEYAYREAARSKDDRRIEWYKRRA
jgi:hypothetical protein